jgi:hypothetical protein
MGEPPAMRSNSTCRTNSNAPATMSEAQSRLKTPGTMRRSGFTAQSVSAIVNCAMGFRAGARKACIQKRTSAARMKMLKIASRTNARALLTMVGLQSFPNAWPSSFERSHAARTASTK